MKKYQIFISSTFEDLKEERKSVLDVILRMNQIPAGMELFGAADKAQWELIKQSIDTSDYYILIIGRRYGSTLLYRRGQLHDSHKREQHNRSTDRKRYLTRELSCPISETTKPLENRFLLIQT